MRSGNCGVVALVRRFGRLIDAVAATASDHAEPIVSDALPAGNGKGGNTLINVVGDRPVARRAEVGVNRMFYRGVRFLRLFLTRRHFS